MFGVGVSYVHYVVFAIVVVVFRVIAIVGDFWRFLIQSGEPDLAIRLKAVPSIRIDDYAAIDVILDGSPRSLADGDALVRFEVISMKTFKRLSPLK